MVAHACSPLAAPPDYRTELALVPVMSNRLIFISTASAFSLLGDQVLYSVLPVYFEELGLQPLQVGLLLSANRWVRLVTNHIAHRAIDRFSPRMLFASAFVLGAVTTLMYTATWSFTVLLVARLAWGLAWSFIRHVGVLGMMVDVSPDRVGRTMGIYNGITRIGSVAGLFLGAMLVDLAGYHPAMVLLALTSFIAVPLALRGTAGIEIRNTGGQGGPFSIGPFEILGVTIGAVGSGFVMATLGAVLNSRMGELDGQLIGLSAATLTGGLLALRFLLDTSAAPWLGGLTDRFGVRNTTGGFLALGAVALGCAHFSNSIWLVATFVVLFFISGTALSAGIAGTVTRFGSSRFSRYVTAADLGSAAGPLLGWWLLDVTGVVTVGLALGAVLYAVTACYAGIALRGFEEESS